MSDPRIERYAALLVDTCLRVERGWQVLVWGYPQARPLLEAVTREIGRRGAYPLLRLTFGGGLVYHRDWVRHAPLELLGEPAPIDVYALEHCDALLAIAAPDNTRDGSDIAPERLAAVQSGYRRSTERVNGSDFPWVMCWYPTPALAQDAGLPLPAFEDFLYDSVLLDWEAEHARLSKYAALFDAANEVRIVGEGTDLRLSVAGRRMEVDAGIGNMPGGEFFGCPVEDSAEGTITFAEFPQLRDGRQLRNVRLRFSGGKVVDASADAEEDFLVETLDADPGARRIGELGIGCNPGITRYMGNVYFDERSTDRSTSRSASASPISAARTSPRSTGTSSRTSAAVAESSSTVERSRRTASGRSSATPTRLRACDSVGGSPARAPPDPLP